jgi:putative spermidine/putrescine transport system permease protein
MRRDLDWFSFHGAVLVLAGLCLVLLAAPTVIVVLVSFTSGFSLRFPPPGYSLRWYAALEPFRFNLVRIQRRRRSWYTRLA